MYRAKDINNKVYSNIMNWTKALYKLEAIFLDSQNIKRYEPYRLLVNFADKLNFKRSDKSIALSNRTHEKYKKFMQKQKN